MLIRRIANRKLRMSWISQFSDTNNPENTISYPIQAISYSRLMLIYNINEPFWTFLLSHVALLTGNDFLIKSTRKKQLTLKIMGQTGVVIQPFQAKRVKVEVPTGGKNGKETIRCHLKHNEKVRLSCCKWWSTSPCFTWLWPVTSQS